MKKTFKRIIALAIVLCTLGAMMIPGVAAEDPSKDLVVNMTNDFKNTLGITSSTALPVATVNAAYEAGTIKWGVHATDTKQLRTRAMSGEVWLQHQQYATNYTHSRFALEFKAPADGKYLLSVDNRYYYKETSCTTVEIFIIKAPETPLTGNNGTLRSTISQLQAADAAILTHESGSKTFTSEKTVSLTGGEEYLLIFAGTGPADATFYGYINGFALKYQAPLDVYDYTVNYHANYTGAESEIYTDVLSSTKLSLEMEVSDSMMVRSGYRCTGWATEPTGEVVYAPGDKISMTSDDAPVDLYAVWAPQSNTTFGMVFTTLDKDFGLKTGDYLCQGLALTANGNIVMEQYNAKTSIWAPYTVQNNFGGSIRYTASGLNVSSRNLAAGSVNRGGVVLLMRAPASGKFTVSSNIVFRPGDDIADSVEIHVMPRPNYELNLHDNRFTLQNFITSRKSFTDLDGNVFTFNEEDAVINTPVQDSTMTESNKADIVTGKEYVFEEGKEYIIVIAACETDESIERRQALLNEQGNSDKKPAASVEFVSMSFSPALPAVVAIDETEYQSVSAAAEDAVPGDTIKLIRSHEATEINLPEGVTLDLNGLTLTATGAVNATVIDSENGEGLLAASQDAIVTTTESQIALWDSTTNASGYRVFNYSFDRYVGENSEVQDSSITNDPDVVTHTLYNGVNNSRMSTLGPQWLANYKKGDQDWRIEATSNPYYITQGYMNTSAKGYYFEGQLNTTYSFRFRSPGEGNATVTLNYAQVPKGASKSNIYIIPASVVDAAWGENKDIAPDAIMEALSGSTRAGDPTGYNTAAANAIAAAINDSNLVIPDVCFSASSTKSDLSCDGTFTFEADKEYILVVKPLEKTLESNTYAGCVINSFSFDLEPTTQNVRTFWSTLEFSNNRAYQIAEASDLKVGFDLYWNYQDGDQPGMSPVFTSTQIGEWADTQIKEGNQGFFVRVSGFEKLLESGDLKVVPFISVKNDKRTGSAMTYHYDLPTVEPTE